MRTRSMRGDWKYRGTVIVVIASAVVLLLGGCSGVGNKPAVSAQATAAASNTGPLAGGVEYLHAFQALNDVYYGAATNPLFDPNPTLAEASPAAGKLMAAYLAFNSTVGKLDFPASVRSAVASMLKADKDATAALKEVAAATNLDALHAALTKFGTTDRASYIAQEKVGTTMDVFTNTPTNHLAAAGLPVVIANLDGRPIAAGELGGGVSSSYGAAGYVQAESTVRGIAGRYTKDIQLVDTSVSTTVVISSQNAGSAVAAFTGIICRSSAAGHAVGTEYALGYRVDGRLRITYRDPLGTPRDLYSRYMSTTDTVKSGTSVKLRADCVGSYLTLYINGKPEIQVYDDQLASGNIGLELDGPGAAVYSTLTASGNTK